MPGHFHSVLTMQPVLIMIFFIFLADNAGVIVNPKGEMKGTANI